MRTRIIAHWQPYILALLGLLLLVGVPAFIYAETRAQPYPLLLEQIAQQRPPERNFPNYPQAENLQQTTTDAGHAWTYTTSDDFATINEFYTQALEQQGWRCNPGEFYHADVKCVWLGKADDLPWDLYLTRHLDMVPGGSKVAITWGRVPNYRRVPVYLGGRVTARKSISCVDDIPLPVYPEEFCGPYIHTYTTPATPAAVGAFYTDLLAFCGPQAATWRSRIVVTATTDGGTQVTIN